MKTALIIIDLMIHTEQGYGYDQNTTVFDCDGIK